MNTVAVETIAKYLATIITPKKRGKGIVECHDYQILVNESARDGDMQAAVLLFPRLQGGT